MNCGKSIFPRIVIFINQIMFIKLITGGNCFLISFNVGLFRNLVNWIGYFLELDSDLGLGS